ncbi:MAG: C-terminal helicase domain-containing protein, partial [Duncaniella sp.]|nr:C-terminal helicase domain-containing protein [Duncaniella sp.]
MKSPMLTPAPPLAEKPDWLPLASPLVIDFSAKSDSPRSRTQIVHIESPSRDKIDTLTDLLNTLPDGRVIVFANHRESVERIYDILRSRNLPVGIYHGGLEQHDRENAIELLNNNSTPILVSTDLGSRGLDIS